MDQKRVKYFLEEAIALAKSVPNSAVHPNPRVGAVLVDSTGLICGRGAHQFFGGPHAEVLAIENAIERGADLKTCTLFVSLEPCSHYGKTPPCTKLLIEHQIPTVFFASADPNPTVDGCAVLQSSGIDAQLIMMPEAIEMNRPFFVNQLEQRPYVYYKSAISKNGLVADQKGNSKWITQIESRAHAHRELRNQVDAILSTSKTILHDRSKLNIRIDDIETELTAIVLDRNQQLFTDSTHPILYPRLKSRLIWVTENNVSNLHLPASVETLIEDFPMGKANLKKLLGRLFQNFGITKLLVESGAALGNSMMQENLIDEYWRYTSTITELTEPGIAAIDINLNSYSCVLNETFSVDRLEVFHRRLNINAE